MAKKQSHSPSRTTVFRVAVVITLLVLTLGISIISSHIGKLERRVTESVHRQNQHALYERAKLTFCHDHEIRPCDDLAIEEWNAAHPDNIFPVPNPSTTQ